MTSRRDRKTVGSRTTVPQGPGSTTGRTVVAVTFLFSPDDRIAGRIQALTDAPLTLGRKAPEGGMSFDDPRASRVHASVEWDTERERYVLHDKSSRNGTWLGGRRIQSELLTPGDVFRVGDTILTYHELDMKAAGWTAPADSLMVGASSALRSTIEDITRVAKTDLSVLVLGETGTGKELAAREVHRLSGRRGAFVPVNCAAIPSDLLESELFGHTKGAFSGADRPKQGMVSEANGGTLFLDEIGELLPGHQAKLLRVLDDKSVRPVGASRAVPVDVRVVAATNRDLEGEVAKDGFRADLLARLDQWTVELSPLRERPTDLMPIIAHVIAAHGDPVKHMLSADFFEALALYPWPLNVRELVATIRRALVYVPDGGRLETEHLPKKVRGALHKEEAKAAPAPARPVVELPPVGAIPTRAELIALLEHYKGNVADVGRHTGRKRMQVYRWLERHGLDATDYRRSS